MSAHAILPRPHRRRESGFTLIESIIVLVLMSTLAILTSELFLTSSQQGTRVAGQSDVLVTEQNVASWLRADMRNMSSSISGSPVNPVSLAPNYPRSLAGTNVLLGTTLGTGGYPSAGITNPADGSGALNSNGNVLRGNLLSLRVPQFTMPTSATATPAESWGNLIEYQFMPMPTASGSLLSKETQLLSALTGAGITVFQLVRTEYRGTANTAAIKNQTLVANMLRYQSPVALTSAQAPPSTNVYAQPFPYFEYDTRASSPRINVCFQILQPFKDKGARNWTFTYHRPVFFSVKLQP